MIPWYYRTSTSALALLAASTLHAAQNVDNQEDIVKLDPITVTTTPLDRTVLDLARPAEVLRGYELLIEQSSTIGETVNEALGVTSSYFGPAVGRPIIRGLRGPRVRVLRDGIGTLDVSALSSDHAVTVAPLHIQRVEILKGPATLLYGSGAVGGVVNVITHRIPEAVPETIYGAVELRYNTAADGFAGAFELNGGRGPFAWHLGGALRETDNLEIPGFAEADPEPGDSPGILRNSDMDTDNFSVGISLIGERGFFGFSFSRYISNYGLPGGHVHVHGHEHNVAESLIAHLQISGHEAEQAHGGEEGGVRIDLKQNRYDFKGVLYDPLPGFQRIKLRAAYNDYRHVEIEPSGEAGTVFSNEAFEGRLELLHNPLAGWQGVLGVQFRYRDFSAIGAEAFVPPVETRAIAGFIVEEREWGRFSLQLGGRFESVHHEPAGLNPVRDFGVFSIAAGAIYEFMPGYQLSLSASRAGRAPAAEALYAFGPHLASHSFERGDPGLDAEISRNVNLALRQTQGRWTWTINLFYKNFDDFIFLQSVDQNHDGVADRVNGEGILVHDEDALLLVDYTQRDAEFYGVEAESVVGLLRGPYGDLDLRVFLESVSGELTGGQDLPRIPPIHFGASLSYAAGQWRSGVEVRRVADQDETAPLETSTDGYTMVNANLSYRIVSAGSTRYTVFLRAANLLNVEARRHVSFLKDQALLPGRSFLFGLRAKF